MHTILRNRSIPKMYMGFFGVQYQRKLFEGPCTSCMHVCSIPVLYRVGTKPDETYSKTECCQGPLCLTCSSQKKIQCIFCSERGEKVDVVTIGSDSESKEALILNDQKLDDYERGLSNMPFLQPFLDSIPHSKRKLLRLTWQRVMDEDIRKMYQGFLQRSQYLWTMFMKRNLPFNRFVHRRCDQDIVHRCLLSNRMVSKFRQMYFFGGVFYKTLQRIPPEFICFCIRQMCSFGNSFQIKLYQAILKKVLSKFLLFRRRF